MVDGYSTALQSLVSSYDIRGMIGSQMRSAYLGEYNNHTNDGGCTGTFVYPFGPAFGTVENVLDGKEWVAYAGNCYDAATGQVIVGGGDPSGPLDAQQIMIDNAYQTQNGKDQLTLNQDGGYRTLINDLKSGKPVMIGVAYHDRATKNHNMLTDHYITAVGMGYDASRKQNYISYYDNYGNHPTNLTINKLYFDKNGISGNGYTKNGVQYFYNVTEVRPNTGRSSKWQFWK